MKLTKIPLPTDSKSNWLHIAHNLLSESECQEIISTHSPSLKPQGVSFTSRSRHTFQSERLATALWTRLGPLYNSTTFTDKDGYDWHPERINDHFRLCKYAVGDGFTPHVDGDKLLDVDLQTMITVNIYLNTASPEARGATRIIVPHEPDEPWTGPETVEMAHFNGEAYRVLYSVHPTAGMAAIFPAGGPLHDGDVLAAGEKYLLRTDIAFRRSPEFVLDTAILQGLGEAQQKEVARELATRALDMASRLEDGGSDNAWLWYKRAFKLCPELESRLWSSK